MRGVLVIEFFERFYGCGQTHAKKAECNQSIDGCQPSFPIMV